MEFSELNVISIDPSLRSTGVYSTYQKGTSRVYQPDRKIYEYYLTICENVLFEQPYDLCLIEKPLMNKRQYEIVGILKAYSSCVDVPFVEVHPDIWRHIMGVKQLLKGVNKKTAAGIRLYLERVKSITGKSFDTTDEADAFLIYRAVCDIMDKPGRLTPAAEKIRLQIKELLK